MCKFKKREYRFHFNSWDKLAGGTDHDSREFDLQIAEDLVDLKRMGGSVYLYVDNVAMDVTGLTTYFVNVFFEFLAGGGFAQRIDNYHPSNNDQYKLQIVSLPTDHADEKYSTYSSGTSRVDLTNSIQSLSTVRVNLKTEEGGDITTAVKNGFVVTGRILVKEPIIEDDK